MVRLKVIPGGAAAKPSPDVPLSPRALSPEGERERFRRAPEAVGGWRVGDWPRTAFRARLLLLTILYVLLTEVLIFLPTLGRYHRSLLESHIASAEIAILPFTESGGEQLSAGLSRQLLTRAGAGAVMLKRPDQHDLFLAHDEPASFDLTIDLRDAESVRADGGASIACSSAASSTLHVSRRTQILHAADGRSHYGRAADPARRSSPTPDRLVLVALVISLATGVLVFLSLYAVLCVRWDA